MPRRPRPTRPARLGLALALAGALAVVACGGTSDVDRQTFQDDLLERTNSAAEEAGEPLPVPEPVAACITDRVYDEFDQAEVNRIYRAATQTELDQDVRDALTLINQDCFEAEGPPVAEDGAGGAEGEADEGEDGTTTTAGTDDPPTTEAGDETTTTAAADG